MKRKCKGINPSDENFIIKAIDECLSPSPKRKRSDTIRLFMKYGKCNRNQALHILFPKKDDQLRDYYVILGKIAKDLSQEIKSENIVLPKVRQEYRVDPSSGKTRLISVLSIKQLLLDHIAVAALKDLTKRIGKYQCSAIEGRGTYYGKNAIEKWLKNKRVKYHLKMDIKNFYGSVDREFLMSWFRKHIKNHKVLFLIETLISNVEKGLAIGSYLSQTIANIYLADIYYNVPCTHRLFYMDDMLFLHTNKRKIKRTIPLILNEIQKLHLVPKEKYEVKEITQHSPIDMMGFRFTREHTTIRKRIFRRLRKVSLKTLLKRHTTFCQAKRLCSYKGFLIFTSSRAFLNTNKIQRTFHCSGKVQSICF